MTFYSMVIIDIDQELLYKKETGDVRVLRCFSDEQTNTCNTLAPTKRKVPRAHKLKLFLSCY